MKMTVNTGMINIRLVPYETAYKQGVFDFTARCFAELGKTFEPAGRHAYYNDINASFEAFWCLLADDAVAGTVGLKHIDSKTAELKAMYLAGELRGRGLGRQMMNTVIEYAGKRGYKSIVLDSISSYHDALRLYEKTGFVPIDRYNDNSYADVFMKLEL